MHPHLYQPTEGLADRMARAILQSSSDEESVVPTLQRAGFTGREIAAHLDAAVAIVDRTRHPRHPNPSNASLAQLTQALAAAVALGLAVQP